MNKQGFLNVILVLLVAALSGGATYYVMTKEAKAPVDQAQVSVVASGTAIVSNVIPSECNGELPTITFVSATSGPVGTKIELIGCNFAGFEGDKTAWIENSKGEKGIIYSEASSTNELLKLTLKSSVCEEDVSYKGGPCSKELALIPGAYQLFVSPWGKTSNKVDFVVIK